MKTLFRVFLLVAVASILLSNGLAQEGQSTPAMAWRLDTNHKLPALFHATSERGGWADVSPIALLQMAKEVPGPEFYDENCSLSALDKDHAWIAINLHDHVVLDFTSSGGKHWVQKFGPSARGLVSVSFLDPENGFLLTARGSLGNHYEWVYLTNDGGEHWKEMHSPTREGSSYYANGIVFRTPLEGWITATNHGIPNAPLFHTKDGAKSWVLQAFPFPANHRGGYATTYPPTFFGKDKKRGILPVEFVPDENKATVNYETNDGGATWHLPKSGVHSKTLN